MPKSEKIQQTISEKITEVLRDATLLIEQYESELYTEVSAMYKNSCLVNWQEKLEEQKALYKADIQKFTNENGSGVESYIVNSFQRMREAEERSNQQIADCKKRYNESSSLLDTLDPQFQGEKQHVSLEEDIKFYSALYDQSLEDILVDSTSFLQSHLTSTIDALKIIYSRDITTAKVNITLAESQESLELYAKRQQDKLKQYKYLSDNFTPLVSQPNIDPIISKLLSRTHILNNELYRQETYATLLQRCLSTVIQNEELRDILSIRADYGNIYI